MVESTRSNRLARESRESYIETALFAFDAHTACITLINRPLRPIVGSEDIRNGWILLRQNSRSHQEISMHSHDLHKGNPAVRALGRFFLFGGIAVLVGCIGGFGLVRANRYYGNLLRGFDAQFYYAAARSLVVQGDFDVTDDMVHTSHRAAFETEYGMPRRNDGGVKNVFPVGMSLIEAVFLWPANRWTDRAENDPVPGYTSLETQCVAFGLLILTALALQALYWLSLSLVSPLEGAWIVLAAWMGTPLLYYTAWLPFTSHPTTFALMVAMLIVADRIPSSRSMNRSILLFGILASVLFLVRPHQAIYTAILAAWRILPHMRSPVQQWAIGTVVGLMFCALAIGFQSQVHFLNTGTASWIAHGKHDHPMISGHFGWVPQWDVVLGSPIRGLLWITPLVGISFLGFAVFPRSVPWWGWASLLSACVQLLILSFWSDPGQGDSFGIRLWCEHVPVVVCGLALWMQALRKLRWFPFKAVWQAAVIGCIAWTTLLCATYISGKLQEGMGYKDVVAATWTTVLGSRSRSGR